MALLFIATTTRHEIAQRCTTFHDFLGTLQRLRSEHLDTKLDADCLYSSFKSFCSTKRRTSRKHGCEEDCSYETQWPVYCAKNVLAATSSSTPSPPLSLLHEDGEPDQPLSADHRPQHAAVAPPLPVADLVSRLEDQQQELDTLRAQHAQHADELSWLRDRLQRATQMVEQAATDIALLRQQQLVGLTVAPGLRTRKRKAHSSTVDLVAALRDHATYTSEQRKDHLAFRLVAWRTDEDASTIGVVCIEAVLTLLNDRLQQAHNPHVRFLPSYCGMEVQNSDDPVHERCQGIDFAAQRYVVAPVSVNANHWAVVAWDNEERRVLLLDSLGDLVKNTHAARLRRIMLRGGERAQAMIRLPVVPQDDQVSCGLFVLFYCCFIVRNPTTWREVIGATTFRVEDMREWLVALKADGAYAAFTLDQLPVCSAGGSSTSVETRVAAGHTEEPITTLPACHSECVATIPIPRSTPTASTDHSALPSAELLVPAEASMGSETDIGAGPT
jgi:hypothetical protein